MLARRNVRSVLLLVVAVVWEYLVVYLFPASRTPIGLITLRAPTSFHPVFGLGVECCSPFPLFPFWAPKGDTFATLWVIVVFLPREIASYGR